MTADAAPARLTDLLRRHADRLDGAGVACPHHDALVLAAHALGASTAELRVRCGAEVAAAALDRLDALVERRAARVPLQHLTGRTGFRTVTVTCRPGVFVPRPETEVLAGLAVGATPPGGIVVEPCTGTGAVALAVAAETTGATVIATDRSRAAVALARHNAERLDLPVDVLHGDLLGPVDPALRGRVDVLVSNPPYLAGGELAACEPEVRDHDPAGALVAGPTGHEVTDRLLEAARPWLRPGGVLLLEVAEVRAADVAERARRAGLATVTTTADLAGRPRVVRAVRP